MLLGIVGKPSCGKSTFFKAITLAEVDIGNYPFTTINPNEGAAHVSVEDPAKEFEKTSDPRQGYVANGKRFVPVQVIDVAGLVPGAHEGKGMGNQFLDDLRQADVLVHVIDVSGSTNEKGESVPALSYDPANDIRFLEEELDMWYLRLIDKGWDKFARQVHQEKSQVAKAVAKQLSGLGVDEQMMKDVMGKLSLDEDIASWDEATRKSIATELRKRTKPMVIACNKIDVAGADKNFARLKEEFPDHALVGCSAEAELALKEAAKHDLISYTPGSDTFELTQADKLSEKQQKALQFIKDTILTKNKSTGVQEVLDKAVFEVLGYIALFPGGVSKLEDSDGNVLPDCFLMPKSTTALDFAYRLHTDFGKNFIKAIDVRTKKPVGKDHPLNHRDIIEIAANK